MYKKILIKLFIPVIFFSITGTGYASIKDAKKAYSQRQYTKAIKLFKEHSSQYPEDGESFMYLGYIYEYQKKYEESIEMFKKAVELKLNNKQKQTCLLKIALYYNYLERWPTVVHYSNRYLKVNPSNKEVIKMRDRAASKGGGSGTIAVENPSSPEKKKKNKTESIKPSKKKQSTSNEESGKSLETYLAKVEKDPQNESARWDLALIYLEKEKYKEADEQLSWLLKKKPQEKLYLYKGGIAKLRLGELDESLTLLNQALEQVSDDDKTILYYLYLNIGHVYNKQSNIELARDNYYKAYDLNGSIIPLLTLIKLCYDNNYNDDVIEASNIILNSKPDNVEALYYSGFAYLKNDQTRKAYQTFIKFYKATKGKKESELLQKYYPAFLELAEFYSNRRKYKLALKYLDSVKIYYPNDKKFLFLSGKSFFYLKNYDAAISFLEQVQDVPASSYLIAKAYSFKKDLEKTKEFIYKAGNLKTEYWSKAKRDAFFNSFREDKDFLSFLENKGKPPVEVAKEENIEKKETTQNPSSSSNTKTENTNTNSAMEDKSTIKQPEKPTNNTTPPEKPKLEDNPIKGDSKPKEESSTTKQE